MLLQAGKEGLEIGDYFARSRDEIIGGCLSFLPSRAEEVRRILQLSCVGSGAVVVVAFSGRAARGLWAPCGSTASTPNFGAYAPWERCDQCCCFVLVSLKRASGF